MRTFEQYEDVVKQNYIYKIGRDVHLLTQFPTAIHHSMLKNQIELSEDDKSALELVEKDQEYVDDNVSQNSKASKTESQY